MMILTLFNLQLVIPFQIDRREEEIERMNKLLQVGRRRWSSERSFFKPDNPTHPRLVLQGGRPPAAVLAENKQSSTERQMAQLNTQVGNLELWLLFGAAAVALLVVSYHPPQIEYLQKTNKALENELSQVTAHSEGVELKMAELQAANSKLASELENLDKSVRG